jgi:serine/threonine protein kinase
MLTRVQEAFGGAHPNIVSLISYQQ